MDKLDRIEFHFKSIMMELGLNMEDDSLKGTPRRIAKLYANEIFQGLKADNFPSITTFENKFNYNEMVTQYGITVNSTCEHHFLPFFGKAHVSYIPKDRVIGLSKLNRVVDYFAKRPQVQERLTKDISDCLIRELGTQDVAVIIECQHTCVKVRGIKHQDSFMRTACLNGVYLADEKARFELFNGLAR